LNLETNKPEQFVESVYTESLDRPETRIDFLGVKIGDVNRDIRADLDGQEITSRSENPYPLLFTEQLDKEVGTITIAVTASESVNLNGLQLALQLEDRDLIGVVPGVLPVTREYFHLDRNGVLRLSYSDINPLSVKTGDVLYSIVIRSGAGKSNAGTILLMEEVLPAELYTPDETRSIRIKYHLWRNSYDVVNPLDFDISPNPFRDEFNIDFSIPSDGLVKIQVFTPMGVLLYTLEKEYTAGKHTEGINLNQWKGANTILLCRLMHGQEAITRKAVMWE
jgi:hypothetical protein